MKKIVLANIVTLMSIPLFSSEPQQLALLEMDLSSLSELTFKSISSLTHTSAKNTPTISTIITSQMIRQSGARSLDELLEIYVPSMMSLHHPTVVGRRFVTRGIVSNDTVLMLVNGKVMNDRYEAGAASERGLSMLGDIYSIEVIRGPGSAVFGAGAIAGVISITTFDGDTFEGADVSIRQGLEEKFTSAEVRIGHKFSENNTLFAYVGVDSYEGANAKDTPIVTLASDTNVKKGITYYEPDEEFSDGIVNLNQSYRDEPRAKLHLQWNIEDFKVWARYTKGGYNMSTFSSMNAAGYDQLSAAVEYNKKISDTIDISALISFDQYDIVNIRDTEKRRAANKKKKGYTHNYDAHTWYRTDRTTAKVGANWTPTGEHKLYLGYEYVDYSFNNDPNGWPNYDISSENFINGIKPWDVNVNSLISEYQWQVSDDFTLFAGGRIDKHSLIENNLNSYRAALIYHPNDSRTFKMIYNKSMRLSDEMLIKTKNIDEPEGIDYYDFVYQEQLSDGVSSNLTYYYAEYDLINYSKESGSSVPIGTTKFHGLEFELKYKDDEWSNLLAITYNKLLDFTLLDPTASNSVSASPQGYGDDFAEIPNWMIKLSSSYKYNSKLELDGSVFSHLGMPGLKDYFGGLEEEEVSDKIDDGMLLVNFALDYKASDSIKLRADFYNILGWADKDVGNRLVRRRRFSRPDSPSMAFSLLYAFGK